MNNPFAFELMLQTVQQTLVDVLGCAPDEVQAQRAIADDLGGDSLDFVELRYVLEKKLGMVLPQKSVLDAFAEIAGGRDQLVDKGRITELAAQVLQRSMFRYDEPSAHAGMAPYEVFSATTVGQWASLCLHMFDHLPAACPECGHEHAVVAASGKAACGSCGAVLKPAMGDEAMARSVADIAASLTQSA
jgi:acyl carrier protein